MPQNFKSHAALTHSLNLLVKYEQQRASSHREITQLCQSLL